ncbi:MBL fold metallo-hydrolase [Streptomyces sp. RS10V-4]|uniref:MBL fold metallo-hydrolase n=1 Tax=Streptomyces rhizoryzae TaxID=2932493 RepID=UPI002005D6DE|nr:MBL fold metallo-hydrolase [Streptomyces rhizoryzae]MCK7624307.1 MBL fold metallo-hydrolase [Streptomyces rhizoryzae]
MAPVLRPLSATTWAWVQDSTDWGFSNAGVMSSRGVSLLFDTQFTLDATRTMLREIAAATPDSVIETLVISHQNGDHTWGNQLLPDAEIITSAASAEHLCHEISPEQLTQLSHSHGTDSISRYAAEHFGRFDFSGITVTQPTRTFAGRLKLTVGGVSAEAIDLGPGHSAGDVALWIPDDGIVFSGDVLFDGGHMIVWSGSLTACVESLDTLLATGAETFVPGHGALMERADVVAFRSYLTEVGATATAYAKEGIPLPDAAARIQAEFSGNRAHPERLFTATAGAYADAGRAEPLPTLELVKGMADLAYPAP